MRICQGWYRSVGYYQSVFSDLVNGFVQSRRQWWSGAWFDISKTAYYLALFNRFAILLASVKDKNDISSILWYMSHLSRQLNCWSLRCSWSIACRRCSNYIFISTSHRASIDWTKTTARRYENQLSLGIWCALCYRFTVLQTSDHAAYGLTLKQPSYVISKWHSGSPMYICILRQCVQWCRVLVRPHWLRSSCTTLVFTQKQSSSPKTVIDLQWVYTIY